MRTYYYAISWSLLLSVCLLSACQNHYFKEAHMLPNAEWDKSNVLTFQVDIQDTSTPYNVILDFSYHASISHLALQATVTMQHPSGESSTENYSIPIKTEDGKHLGDVAGDYGDVMMKIKENESFSETGTYTFSISQAMPPQTVGGISRVGIIIDKLEE